MIDYYRLFNIAGEVPEKIPIKPVKPMIMINDEQFIIAIMVLFSIFFVVLILTVNNWDILTLTNKTLMIITTSIPIILVILIVIFATKTNKYKKQEIEYIKQYESFKKYEDNQKEFNEILELLKIKTDKNKMKQEMEKLKKFCKVYYSPKDPSFCKDNKADEYTVNMVFRRIYENDRSFEDAENAMKYIYSGN